MPGLVLPKPDASNPSLAAEQLFVRLPQLLEKNTLTSPEDRITSAFQWAGRATVAVRREEAFTFYMIAPETLILGKKKRPEITCQPKYKLAHLLKATVEARRHIVESMNMIYNSMSEIVHSGRFHVTETELVEARGYVKHALFTIMQAEPFRDMTDEKQLDAWLEDQLLAGGP